MRSTSSTLDGGGAPVAEGVVRSSARRVRPWLALLGVAALSVILWAAIPGIEVGEPVEAPPATLAPAEGPVRLVEVVDGTEFIVVGGRAALGCVDLNVLGPAPQYLGEACGDGPAVGAARATVDRTRYLAVFGTVPMEATGVLVADPLTDVETRLAPRAGVWLHLEPIAPGLGQPIERHVVFVDGRGDELGSDVVRLDPEG